MTSLTRGIIEMNILKPNEIAQYYKDEIKSDIRAHGYKINIVGFLVSDDPASITYSEYTREACEDVGISFDLRVVDRDVFEEKLIEANADSSVHGIFIYYPIFGDARDDRLKNIIDYRKDVEGLTSHWIQKLYNNERFDDAEKKKKAILPCTPLAIIKLLERTGAYYEFGLPFLDKTITVFNRSEVVGKPLAYMLSNDGAKVYSFDIDGCIEIYHHSTSESCIPRAEALKQSDIVITGVPSKNFEKVRASELKHGAICLNFSTIQNFEDDAKEAAETFVPRVGTLTVAMCLRNALTLYKNYHEQA